jgi:hypothetical protein
MTTNTDKEQSAYERGERMGYSNTMAIYDPPIRLLLPLSREQFSFNRGFRAGAAKARDEQMHKERAA